MKTVAMILAPALALAACQPVQEDPEEADASPTASGRADTPATRDGPYVASAPLPPSTSDPATGNVNVPGSLVGEYRVAGVDGRDVDLPHAITLSITAETIRYTSQCVGGTWRYRREGDRLVTQEVPLAVCQRALYPEEEAIDALFAAGPTFRRTEANGIELSGGGHTVTVFSQ